jgi:hypothetical protein
VSFDIIAAIVLTLCAAVVVSTILLQLPPGSAVRATAGTISVLWFVLVLACGAAHVFDPERGIGVIGMGLAAVLPVMVGIVVGRKSAVRAAVDRLPPAVLVGVHTFRIAGAYFIALYVQGRLAAPFALVAGWGDVLVALTAIPVTLYTARGLHSSQRIAFGWSVFGLADLVIAVTLGIMSAPDSPLRIFEQAPGSAVMRELPWALIPGFLVPIWTLVHLALFRRLRDRNVTEGRDRRICRMIAMWLF